MGRTMAELEIGLLRSFVEIAACGGFGRAARRLNRTQSTVSLHMRRLEQAAGARLIERGPRHFALTEAGRMLLEDAERLLAQHDQCLARLRGPTLAGALSVGVSEDFVGRQTPRILASFTLAHPGVRLEVRAGLAGAMRRALKQGEVDLLVARRLAGARDGGRPLWREQLVWVAGAAEAAAAPVIPLVVFGEGCLYRAAALAALKRAGRRWRIAFTGSGLAGVQSAVIAGLGVSVLGRSAVLPGMRVPAAADGLPPLPETEIALYCRARPNAALAALARLVEERFVPPQARDDLRALF
ncbi:MAG: LysR substrate-binding domain-containing protein [Alphaproteobacteria bacterium]|nr:LysR substrate-binding domain-containing protein [Alphaproteobacteria bacterium]